MIILKINEIIKNSNVQKIIYKDIAIEEKNVTDTLLASNDITV